MNNFGHDNPGQSIFQGSDLATIQVNNDFEDDEEDPLDKQRLDQELKLAFQEVLNESEANMSVISSSHCSDASEDDLESNLSHSRSTGKSKRNRAPPILPVLQHYVNSNFQPDFHKDGSYPSPIPQYNPQLNGNKHIKSNDVAQDVSKRYVYEGLSNEAGYENLQAMYEIKRSEVNKLEKELNQFKMQAGTEIDNLRKNILIKESESQRTIMEYQQQCENLKNKNAHLEDENLILKQKIETAEKSNSKLTKDLEKIRINMINLEEQLTNLSRNNGSKQYDTNVDFIITDLKKKHHQEVANLQDQYKSVLEQLKSKDRHCTMLTNELKKLQQEHHHTIMDNSNSISNLTKELNKTKNIKFSNSNYDDLNSQLNECSKQNEHLNNTLQKLTAENQKLRSNMSALHITNIDKHGINDLSKLEEDYQSNLELLQKQRDDVKKLTEILNSKDRSIAEMEKKEVTYKQCMHKIQFIFQQELEKYSHDKTHTNENQSHDCETLRNAIEMQLEDTMCKLIRTEENMSTLSKQVPEKDKVLKNNSIEEYMHYHQLSLENISKQKDGEIEKLKNRIEEYIKEIDELKQLYVKVCSEKEHSLNEKEKFEKRLDELSTQFETLEKQYSIVVKEKEELAISLVSMKKEITHQELQEKQLLEKEIDNLKNELMMYKSQKDMIAQLKIELAQSKERVLSTEKRLQSECNCMKYVEQLDNLKKQFDEKVDELKLAKDLISKLTSSDIQISAKVLDEENILKSKLSDCENALINTERKHKLAINEIIYKYKNELHELENLCKKKCSEEKVLCAKIIEELKSKHNIEINTLNTVAKQKADDNANQELIQIVADHKLQFEKANEIMKLKNNTIKELEMNLENAKMDISSKSRQLEQLKDMRDEYTTNIDMLKEQIEEERSKFAAIMTNWAQEMRQMKDNLAATVAEREKLQVKYSKVKHSALGYKHTNQKLQRIYNELLADCKRFMDELKFKTDQLLLDKENEIKLALIEFDNECKQRRLVFGNVDL